MYLGAFLLGSIGYLEELFSKAERKIVLQWVKMTAWKASHSHSQPSTYINDKLMKLHGINSDYKVLSQRTRTENGCYDNL